jgi:hypothetical protein
MATTMGTAIGIIGTVLAVISLWLAWRWNRQSKQEIDKIRDETVASRVVLNNRLDQGVALKLEDSPGKWATVAWKAKEGVEPGPDLRGIWVVERSGQETVVVHDRHAMEALIKEFIEKDDDAGS